MVDENPYAAPMDIAGVSDEDDDAWQIVPFSGSITREGYRQFVNTWSRESTIGCGLISFAIVTFIVIRFVSNYDDFTVMGSTGISAILGRMLREFGAFLVATFVLLACVGGMVFFDQLLLFRRNPHLAQPIRGTWQLRRCEIHLSNATLIFDPRAAVGHLLNVRGMQFNLPGFRIVLLKQFFENEGWNDALEYARKAFKEKPTRSQPIVDPPKNAIVVSRLSDFRESASKKAEFWTDPRIVFVITIIGIAGFATFAYSVYHYQQMLNAIPHWRGETNFFSLLNIFGVRNHFAIGIVAIIIGVVGLASSLAMRWLVRESAPFRGDPKKKAMGWFTGEGFTLSETNLAVVRTWHQFRSFEMSRFGIWMYIERGSPIFLPRQAFYSESDWQQAIRWSTENKPSDAR